jgi:hypothetical protein
MKTAVIAFCLLGCSGGPFSGADLNDGGLPEATGGQASTGGSSAVIGGQASTGGSSAGTGGQASTGGSSPATGGQASTGGSSTNCVPDPSITCTDGTNVVVITAQRNFIAIQCKDNTYWCKGGSCTLGVADDQALLCVKGSCQYIMPCKLTGRCVDAVASGEINCSCSSSGNVACIN